MSKLPITEVLPVQSFAVSVFVAAGGALADGEVTPSDAMLLGPVAFKLPSLLKVQWGAVLPQLADLDDAEKVTLKKAFAIEFDLTDDIVEAHFEDLYGAVLDAAAAINRGKVAVTGIKAAMAAKGLKSSKLG